MCHKPEHACFCVSIKLTYAFYLTLVWHFLVPHFSFSHFQRFHRSVPAMKTLVRVLALYADPQSQIAERYRQTDGRTDGRHDDANSSWSYCVKIDKCLSASLSSDVGAIIKQKSFSNWAITPMSALCFITDGFGVRADPNTKLYAKTFGPCPSK